MADSSSFKFSLCCPSFSLSQISFITYIPHRLICALFRASQGERYSSIFRPRTSIMSLVKTTHVKLIPLSANPTGLPLLIFVVLRQIPDLEIHIHPSRGSNWCTQYSKRMARGDDAVFFLSRIRVLWPSHCDCWLCTNLPLRGVKSTLAKPYAVLMLRIFHCIRNSRCMRWLCLSSCTWEVHPGVFNYSHPLDRLHLFSKTY